MNSIPVLGIPHYNRPDLLARCLASIDHPVEKLVVVQNGPDEQMLSIDETLAGNLRSVFRLVDEIIVIRHPNAGVAGAWNEIIKLCPAPWWLIANNDIEFAPGDLEKMASHVQTQNNLAEGSREAPAHMIYGNHGASWFAITAHGIACAGLFDENIFPAYLEDCDMSRRFDLLRLRRCDVPDVHATHGDGQFNGSCTIMSDPALREKNGTTHGRNFDYYRAKWGGNNEQETFKTPFNDPNWPVWAWKFDPEFRCAQSA